MFLRDFIVHWLQENANGIHRHESGTRWPWPAEVSSLSEPGVWGFRILHCWSLISPTLLPGEVFSAWPFLKVSDRCVFNRPQENEQHQGGFWRVQLGEEVEMKAFESSPRQCLVYLEKDTLPNGSFISILLVIIKERLCQILRSSEVGLKTDNIKTFEKIAMFKYSLNKYDWRKIICASISVGEKKPIEI